MTRFVGGDGIAVKPSSLTVTVWPAIVSVAERSVPVFAAITYVTVPLPVPLLPPVTVIQAALLVAVHEHPLVVVTVVVLVAPDEGTLCDVDDSV
jgi:hypothetical protein